MAPSSTYNSSRTYFSPDFYEIWREVGSLKQRIDFNLTYEEAHSKAAELGGKKGVKISVKKMGWSSEARS